MLLMERPAANADGANTGDGVTRATGRSRLEWFALLDEWGAKGRPYREISDWLTGDQGISRWWAQKLIVEYEEARGVRPPGVRRDGTFEVGASKVVGLGAERVRPALTDSAVRRRWLDRDRLRDAETQADGSIRFGWEDGVSRVTVLIEPRGEAKCLVAIRHDRLPDAAAAAQAKAFWRERLRALEALVRD